jgi:ribosome-associated protein
MDELRIDARVVIPESDLSWTAVRSSGPGGQHVNKTATKVELRFDLRGTTSLPAGAKARLRALARGRLDPDGRLLVVSQKTREQGRNLEDARERLAELVRQALVVPKVRRATRPTRASKARRVEAKRQRSAKKQMRGSVGVSD